MASSILLRIRELENERMKLLADKYSGCENQFTDTTRLHSIETALEGLWRKRRAEKSGCMEKAAPVSNASRGTQERHNRKVLTK